jgi:hypothetical protein
MFFCFFLLLVWLFSFLLLFCAVSFCFFFVCFFFALFLPFCFNRFFLLFSKLLNRFFWLKKMRFTELAWTVHHKPSRLDVAELTAEGVNRVTVNWVNLLEQIQKFRSDEWGEG